MELTKEEARDIVWGDHENWETIEENIHGSTRWSTQYSGIFKHLPSERFYELDWSVGATEIQDESPFEYTDPDPQEVHQVEKVVKVWERIK